MKKTEKLILSLAIPFILGSSLSHASTSNVSPIFSPSVQSPHSALSLTPPLGRNSYDAFGDSVTVQEFLIYAEFVKEKLLTYGWDYVVVEYFKVNSYTLLLAQAVFEGGDYGNV